MCGCQPTVVTVDLTPVMLELDQVVERLTTLETFVTTASEALASILAQEDANSAILADVFADVRALVALLRNTEPDLKPETLALVAQVSGKLQDDRVAINALNDEIGDADGSDTPPAPEPEPAPGE